jgi:hypothetical protein
VEKNTPSRAPAKNVGYFERVFRKLSLVMDSF